MNQPTNQRMGPWRYGGGSTHQVGEERPLLLTLGLCRSSTLAPGHLWTSSRLYLLPLAWSPPRDFLSPPHDELSHDMAFVR